MRICLTSYRTTSELGKRDSVTNVEYTYAKLPVPTHETVLGIFILVFETNAMISVYRTIKVEVFK